MIQALMPRDQMSGEMFILVMAGGAAMVFIKLVQLFRLPHSSPALPWLYALAVLALAGLALAGNLLGLSGPGTGMLVLAGAVVTGLVIRRTRQASGERPDLGKRQWSYVGRSFVLDEPIRDGRGKLLIDGSVWDVLGPDAPAGARVKVTGTSGFSLRVAVA